MECPHTSSSPGASPRVGRLNASRLRCLGERGSSLHSGVVLVPSHCCRPRGREPFSSLRVAKLFDERIR